MKYATKPFGTTAAALATLSLLCAAAHAGPNEDIVVGQCAASHGSFLGPWSRNARRPEGSLKAAWEEENAKGGVKGRKIKLLSADDQYEPEKCVDCTASMIENSHVSILAGYVGTPTAKVAVPIVQESKTPLIGIFSGAMLLREPVQRYVLNASYDDETEELVKYLGDKLGDRKIAVLNKNDSFGLASLGGTEKALGKRGLKLAAKGSFERNTIAVKSGLADILSGNPDAVIMVGPYKPIAEFVRQAHAAGLKSVLANIAANLTNIGEEEGQYYHFLRVAVLAFVKGASPMTAVEFAQRSVPSSVRPSFKELEAACRGGGKGGASGEAAAA